MSIESVYVAGFHLAWPLLLGFMLGRERNWKPDKFGLSMVVVMLLSALLWPLTVVTIITVAWTSRKKLES